MTLTADTGSSATHDGIVRNPQVDFDTVAGGPWDGRRFPYIPREPLPVPSGLALHEEFDADIDPITFQVLRSRFWHLNLEHGDVLTRVSGSAVIVVARDFATALLTESGDIVTISPTLQYFSGVADLVVKWTLENRGDNIRDGDVFMHNDPYVGTGQQADVVVYAPVFHEGRIFGWIFNCSHMGDVGGVDPGGWTIHARDIHDEGITLPPVKVVREGVVDHDLIEAFARQGREPKMLTLGVRSAVAGITATRARMAETLEKYGAPVVKGAMRKMIADTSRVFGERLRRLPDGTWRERIYLTGIIGERISHPETVVLTKRGDRVFVSNEGTAPQSGPGNTTYAVFRSAVISALSTHLAHDQFGCMAGVGNHVVFEPVPGTRNIATYPGACAALASAFHVCNVAGVAVSKMVLGAPADVRAHANGSGALALPVAALSLGLNADGSFASPDPVGGGMAGLAGGLGAFPYRDGIDAGGAWWLLGTTAGNVEETEDSGITLTLWRRENPDSGGPGQWRGGNGASIAYVPHQVDMLIAAFMLSDPATNPTDGLGGGYPGLGSNHYHVPEVVGRMLGEGRPPADIDDIDAEAPGSVRRVNPMSDIAPVPPGDCVINQYNGGGGYGDPLAREAARVVDDVVERRISAAAALRHWGVVVDGSGTLDQPATDQARQEIRDRRRAEAIAPDGVRPRGPLVDPEVVISGAAGSVDVARTRDGLRWACQGCAEDLGAADDNFKLSCLLTEDNPHHIDQHLYPDPREFGDAEIVLRRYHCPGCVTLLSVELCRTDDEPLFDFAITALSPEGD